MAMYYRSGKYVYKPTMNRTCCPQYPIRSDVNSLCLTKSQKKVIKRVNRYLSYGERQATTSGEPERHGHEELPAATAAGVAAAHCQKTSDDATLEGTASSSFDAESDRDATAAGASGSQFTKTESSSGCEKKVMHRTPKPGVWVSVQCFVMCE